MSRFFRIGVFFRLKGVSWASLDYWPTSPEPCSFTRVWGFSDFEPDNSLVCSGVKIQRNVLLVGILLCWKFSRDFTQVIHSEYFDKSRGKVCQKAAEVWASKEPWEALERAQWTFMVFFFSFVCLFYKSFLAWFWFLSYIWQFFRDSSQFCAQRIICDTEDQSRGPRARQEFTPCAISLTSTKVFLFE